MEYIKLSNPSLIPNLAERTAEALRWFSQTPPPPEDDIRPTSKHMIGPVGSGLIRHSFFKNHTAPLHFSSVDALERYMNRVRRCLRFFHSLIHGILLYLTSALFVQGRKLLSGLATDPAKPVRIVGESLIFTQSDMHISNFGVDKWDNAVLMDFAEIGRLPLSFAKFTMMKTHDSFVTSVTNLLCWPASSNIRSMASVSSCLWMVSDPKLGAGMFCVF